MRKSSTRSLIFAARAVSKPVASARLPDEVNAVGTAYTMEQVREILDRLESKRRDAQLEGLKAIIRSPNDIISAVIQDNEVSDRYFLKTLVRVANENEDALIGGLAQEKDGHGLKFLAACSFLPESYNKKALETLKQISPEAAKEVPEPAMLKHLPLEEDDVLEIFEGLCSENPKVAVESAVDFISNYPALVAEVTHIPDIAVTELTEAGIAAIENNPSEVVTILEERSLVPELFFIAEHDSISDEPRQLAVDALVRLEKTKPKEEPVIKVNTGANDGVAVFSAEEFIQNLQSDNPEVVADSISHFLHDYNDMLENVTSTPNLSVSDVLKKLMKGVDENMDAVMARLEGEESEDDLEFMSTSDQFSPRVQRKAREKLLEMRKKKNPPVLPP